MAIFRPQMGGGKSFYGICEIALNNFEDKHSLFDWADIFIDVTINQKNSEYTRNIKIAGSLERDSKGEKIDNIANYLNDKFIPALIPDDELVYKYLAYIYKEKPKKDGDKAWTRVYHKIYSNIEANKAKLQEDVDWLKGKGVIKEATNIPIQSNGNTLKGSGLASL